MRLFYVLAAARFQFDQTKWVFYIENRSFGWWTFYQAQSTTNMEAPLKLHLISPLVDTDIEVKMKHRKWKGGVYPAQRDGRCELHVEGMSVMWWTGLGDVL